jgi:SAM-dependent methyltransferase
MKTPWAVWAKPEPAPPKPNPLDNHCVETPGHANAMRLFDGLWSSAVPGFETGKAELFDDARIAWFETQCGGFAGKNILELGPLEGAHTAMMARAGAKVRAIESNSSAFLRCLVVKNALQFSSEFLLGDFRKYVAETTDRYDAVVASGVLYHMTDPVTLLSNISRVSDRLCLWTHYYDHETIMNTWYLPPRFENNPSVSFFNGRRIEGHRYYYLEGLEWGGFSGGAAPHSLWLTKASLLGALGDLGYTVTVGGDHLEHPQGPCMTIFASR